MILPFRGVIPKISDDAFVAATATIIGDVEIGSESGIWFGVILRGDVNRIRIGARTNLQDGTIVHVTRELHPTTIGSNVTVGHGVKLHGCRIDDGCLVGIGAIVLDGAHIGEESLVAAGSLVVPGTVAPPRSLLIGNPARVKRSLRDDEVAGLADFAVRYVGYRLDYL